MKKLVFTFGRMNPPTVGHQKLVDKVNTVARSQKADARVYLSHSQNNKKDPLDYDSKINLAKKAFGSSVTKSSAKTIIEVLKELEAQKYTDIVLVVGSDRIREFKTLLDKYNGKDYTFNSIKYQSAGQRDPDAEGVSGMSASKMRAAAKEGDLNAFKSGLPKPLQSSAKSIYDQLRGIMEQSEELEERVLTVQQRIMRGRIMKRLAKRFQLKRRIKRKRFADKERLMMRARKAARNILRRRFAGARGAKYGELGRSEKITVDKLVDKRSKIITKLAQKLLPRVRKAEVARVAAARRGPKDEGFDWENDDRVFDLFEQEANEFMTELLLEVAQDKDIDDREGAQPAKYHSGLSKSTKIKRDQAFKRGSEKDSGDPSAYPDKHPGDDDVTTRTSKHTKKYHQMFGEKATPNMDRVKSQIKREKEADKEKHDRMRDTARLRDTLLKNRSNQTRTEEFELEENAHEALMKKAEKSGISYSVLKKVYDRGMAAWRTGHRPGAGQEQWAFARVNSFITKGKGTWGKADADLARQVKGESVEEQRVDEISKDAANRYMWSAMSDRRERDKKISDAQKKQDKKFSNRRFKNISKMYDKNDKRTAGIGRALNKLSKEDCWDGYTQQGMKKKGDKVVPNCVKEEIEEAKFGRAARDAKKDMRFDKDMRQVFSKDIEATGDDKNKASKNMINQLKRAIDFDAKQPIEFEDGKKVKIPMMLVKQALYKYVNLRRPDDKLKFVATMSKSYNDMKKVVSEEKIPHALDPKKSLKHAMTDVGLDIDVDGDVDVLDKMAKRVSPESPDEVTGTEKNTKEIQAYLKKRGELEKKHTKKGIAYEAVSPAQQAAIAIAKKKSFKEMMDKACDREEGTKSLRKSYTKDTPGQTVKEAIEYHKINSLCLKENIFRPHSEQYYKFFCEARRLWESGELEVKDPFDITLLKSDAGLLGIYEGREVPLDIPLVEEEDEKNPPLNKPKRGGTKKFYVYVKDPSTGNIKKVSFGDTSGLKAKIDNPEARKSFVARHQCASKTDKTTPGYWACRLPYYAKELGLSGGGSFFW